jgi:hypothetical protein
LPSEVLGLTKIGTVDKAGQTCYVTYINRTIGITKLVVESTTKGVHFLQFVLSDGTSNRYGRQATPTTTPTRVIYNFTSTEPLVGLWGYLSPTGGVNAIGVVQLNQTVCQPAVV